jgi:hypothetical protein
MGTHTATMQLYGHGNRSRDANGAPFANGLRLGGPTLPRSIVISTLGAEMRPAGCEKRFYGGGGIGGKQEWVPFANRYASLL